MARVLAVAGLTVRALVRQRGAMLPAGLLLLIVAALPLVIRDDGTLSGRLRLLLSYGLGLGQAGLGLLTAWLAAEALPGMLADGQLELLASRPVARWRVWVGTWLGIVLGATLLLAALGLVVAIELAVTLGDSGRDPAEVARARAEVLSARSICRPLVPNFEFEAQRRAEAEVVAGSLPVDRLTERAAELRRELLAGWQTVAAGTTRHWQLDPIPAAVEPGRAALRFTIQAASPDAVDADGEWRVNGLAVSGAYLPGTTISLPVAGELAAGVVSVSFTNRSNAAVAVPLADGPLLLYRSGGFTLNLLRALGLQWLMLAFLAALGMAVGGAVSFPVAALVVVGYLVAALHVPLLAVVVDQGMLVDPHSHSGPGWVEDIARGALRIGAALTGGVVAAWPVGELAGGLALGERIAEAGPRLAASLALVVALGLTLWQRRELGRG